MFADESLRQREFPVTAHQIFLAHAAVTALPRAVAQAEIDYVTAASQRESDYAWVAGEVRRTRALAAQFLPGASPEEIALLGPTALGLSLFAAGLDWQPGDEVVYHADCYPANVYPWMELARRSVRPVAVQTERYGEITWEVVERALTPRTRLVALASAHFLTGFRVDVDGIGRRLHERGILFSVDAIQTLGAFPLDVTHVDFLSADAHKWMLGPLAIGIVMVKRAHFERLRPILLGASNVRCPEFIAQPEIVFPDRAERYEPGVLNVAPLLGMRAGLEILHQVGVEQVAARILHLKRELMRGLGPLGFEAIAPVAGPAAAGLLTLRHPSADPAAIYQACKAAHIVPSLRSDRAGQKYLRFSPHFYNTEAELARVV
ncbi:MAG: aminotransferase class V-fold PLP-dependent enzyme, partial [Verrucomicrobia bacterium]|nr:aminotransferase class V-fold PLP-dependent enzyme [Verrucomicrobiota bacterium]